MRFIKENPALAVGIGLPVVLVLLFSLAALIPQWTVEGPRYSLLFTIAEYDEYGTNPEYNLRFNVVGGHLKAEYLKPAAPQLGNNKTRLYLFNSREMTVRAIPVQPPSAPTELRNDHPLEPIAKADGSKLVITPLPVGQQPSNQWQEFPVPEAATMALDTSSKAPDGYEFNNRGGYNGSGLGWPFFSRGYDQQAAIVKNNRVISIPSGLSNTRYYNAYNTKFLGWVISGDTAP